MRAWLNLRYTTDKRAQIFRAGLERHGYEVTHGLTQEPGEQDIFVTWNRIGAGNNTAKLFEKRGLRVLVVENASWGNSFAGNKWYHIAHKYHNTRGCFPVGDTIRWDSLEVPLAPWRTQGETVILPQRGIGSDPVRMPRTFAKRALKEHRGRVRVHPGKRQAKTLEDDLAKCGKVITWGSGAAVKAVMMGIPCVAYMPEWIGKQDNTDLSRLLMLRRLAWAQWRHSEIETGEAFEGLLQ